jgi:hypothetical protein
MDPVSTIKNFDQVDGFFGRWIFMDLLTLGQGQTALQPQKHWVL